MGVYLHNMEMPIIEMEWTIRYGADGKWYAIDTNAETTDGEWHEIIHVPPHGDLIDRDALIADLKRQCKEVFRVNAVSPDDFWITRNEAYNERLWGTWCESFYGYLQTRPTIIPAEEGE